MGEPRKRRKQFEAPKRLWDAARIKEERKLVEEYGLKNMHELWRMKTILRKIRREARRLQSAKGKKIEERTQALWHRVKSFLIPELKSLEDILALDTRQMLERRLQTRVVRLHLAKTMLQSRQFIAHGHISVKGQRVTAPSYLVKFDEENAVSWYNEPIKIEQEQVSTV